MSELEDFRCGVCGQLLRDPVSVPCGHSFCLNCVRAHWDREKEEGDRRRKERDRRRKEGEYRWVWEEEEEEDARDRGCSCPQCGEQFRHRPLLAVNGILSALMEALKTREAPRAVPRAVPGVAPGRTDPGRTDPGRTAVPGSLPGAVRPSVAPLQPTVPPQTVGFVVPSSLGSREWLQRDKERLRRRIQQKEKDLSALERRLKDVAVSAAAAEKRVDRGLKELVTILKERLSEANQQVKSLQEEEEHKVLEVLSQVQRDREALSKEHSRLDQLCQIQDHFRFLQAFTPPSDVQEETASDAVSKISNSPKPFFWSAVNNPANELRDNLKIGFREYSEERAKVEGNYAEIKKRTIHKDSQNSITHIFVPDTPDPMPRDELLKYARDVTFDPNTAHHNIVLSAENRKVKYVQRKHSYRKHPERFNRWIQVLSKEPLAGRCYIEVDISADQMLRVALAYKDTPRKGLSDLGGFGFNKTSWAWFTYAGDVCHFTHNGKRTEVWSTWDQDRLGIFLDHDAGVLKFYRLDDAELLHEIHTTFTEPLYLGVGFQCVGESVEVCQLE